MFHGQSGSKIIIKYNKTGDGFQVDSICSNGYILSFYFWDQPPPKQNLDKGLSPLHSQIMFILDQLKSQYHSVQMYNLYMHAYCARKAIQIKNKLELTVSQEHTKD